ncbi:MAG: HAMP domain-containing sensor histidine kinase [Ilumatobacteraceae bacterium]
MRAFRLRSQLAIGQAVVALGLMTVATAILASRTDDLRRSEAVVGAQRDAEVLAAQVAPRLEFGRRLDGVLPTTSSRNVEIVDPSGQYLAGERLVDDPAVADAVAAALNQIGAVEPTGRAVQGSAIGLEPVLLDDELRAVVVVAEGLPARRGWRQLYGLDPPAALLLAAVAALIGWWLAGTITRPLGQLTEQARTLLLDGPIPPADPVSRIREVAVLRSAISSLDRRVRADGERREQTEADLRRLSHEMRNPLTTIRLRVDDLAERLETGQPGTGQWLGTDQLGTGQLGTGQLGTGQLRVDPSDGSTPARVGHHSIDVVERQLDRLEALSRQLSSLPVSSQALDDVDAAATAQQVVQRLRPVAQWCHVVLEVRSNGSAVVHAAPDELADAIANVVENAIKHSPRGGRVTVDVTHDPVATTIAVADEGPGIPAQWRSLVLQPGVSFGSAGVVRSTGQGLAIVARIVDRTGGRLEIEDRQPSGTLVRLCLVSGVSGLSGDRSVVPSVSGACGPSNDGSAPLDVGGSPG